MHFHFPVQITTRSLRMSRLQWQTSECTRRRRRNTHLLKMIHDDLCLLLLSWWWWLLLLLLLLLLLSYDVWHFWWTVEGASWEGTKAESWGRGFSVQLAFHKSMENAKLSSSIYFHLLIPSMNLFIYSTIRWSRIQMNSNYLCLWNPGG